MATWREGDDKWAYRDDAAANIARDKVSLDYYRLVSRKILALVKEVLPRDLQKVEKASIDEVFLDLSAQVHSEMLRRFPELSSPPPYDDVTELLPLPSTAALDWQADSLVDLDEEEEFLDPDWDDVAIFLGSEIVRNVRVEILEKLGYTCSAGVANNKLISKLGSAFKKPNRQTVIRCRATQVFLEGFEITKLRNLGGKLGDQVVSSFNTNTIKGLLDVSLELMKSKLGDDTGVWVHNTIRGIDHSEVNSRTQIKSMLSAKSFRPFINTADQAIKWLVIFAGDIYSRLVEEGVVENKRRPRSINLHHRHAGQTRSRQGPIPQGKPLDEKVIFGLAKDLFAQIVAEGNIWPCSNLSLSVGGFEEGVKGNMGIGAFLVKGEEAASLRLDSPGSREASTGRPSKKARVDNDGIQRFFSKKPSTSHGETNEQESPNIIYRSRSVSPDGAGAAMETGGNVQRQDILSDQQMVDEEGQILSPSIVCSRCKVSFVDALDLQSHEDWHMAKDLQDEERGQSRFVDHPVPSRSKFQKGSGPPAKQGRGGSKLEQGQKTLKFG